MSARNGAQSTGLSSTAGKADVVEIRGTCKTGSRLANVHSESSSDGWSE